MNRADIEKAIEEAYDSLDVFENRWLEELVKVAEAWRKLEEWVSTGLVEGSRDPYDCAMYAVEEKMHALLNPAPKSDLERIKEFVNERAVFNRGYQDLKKFIDQLEAEKEHKEQKTCD